jgi:hypothetical protein
MPDKGHYQALSTERERMKLYGYKRKEVSKGLLEMREVTVSCNPGTLRELATFITRCADGMEKDPERWDHEHFAICDEIQFIVSNPKGGK